MTRTPIVRIFSLVQSRHTLLLLGLLACFFILGFSKFTMRFSLKNLYGDSIQQMKKLYSTESEGLPLPKELSALNDDQAFILIRSERLFELEEIAIITGLQEELIARLPGLERLHTPFDGWNQAITDRASREKWFTWVEQNPLVGNKLVWREGSAGEILFVADFKSDFTSQSPFTDNAFQLGAELEAILQDYAQYPLQFYTAGANIIEYRLNKEVLWKTSWTIAIGFVLAILLGLVFLRSTLFFLANLAVLALGELSALGLFSWLGYETDANFILVPVMIGFIVCTCNSIHLHSYFQRFLSKHREAIDRKMQHAAMDYALRHCLKPIFYTSITTIAGTMSFSIVSVEVLRWMGFLTSTLIAMIFLYSIIFLPAIIHALIQFKKPHSPQYTRTRKQQNLQDIFWPKLGTITHRFKRLILSSFVIGIVLAVWQLPKLEINLDRRWMMGDRIRYIQELEQFSSSRLTAEDNYTLVLGFSDKPLEPEKLRRLDAFCTELQELAYVENTSGLSSVIRNFNAYLKGKNELPASPPLINGLIVLLKNPPLSLNMTRLYGSNYYRINVGLGKYDALFLEKHLQEVRSLLKRHFPESGYSNLSFAATGSLIDFANMNKAVSKNLLSSQILSIVLVMVILSLLFQSIQIGLVLIIPNITPIIGVGFLMSLNQTPIDFLLICVGPIVLGMAVDDSIHLASFLQNNRYPNYQKLHQAALQHIGTAITKTSIINCSLFLCFAISGVRNITFLGLYCALGMLLALLTDLSITPLLFENLHKRALRHDTKLARLNSMS